MYGVRDVLEWSGKVGGEGWLQRLAAIASVGRAGRDGSDSAGSSEDPAWDTLAATSLLAACVRAYMHAWAGRWQLLPPSCQLSLCGALTLTSVSTDGHGVLLLANDLQGNILPSFWSSIQHD